ncbi:uncharacterized protein UTRI_10373 [Ustilago trichophora]|uniref:Uncharacterized protein n=1 Tax=Ustilago trichophora TaxID=86804 RepID=A0A5C3ECE6_9BASI|nr:uncharacterized protein UTRI_10373 [Ustilago trichophora]
MVWLTHLLELRLSILALILSLCCNFVISNNIRNNLHKTMIEVFLFDQYHVHARYSVPIKRLSAPPTLRPTLDAYTQVQALELAHTDGSKSVGTISPSTYSPVKRIYFYSIIKPDSQVGRNINLKPDEMASLLWCHEKPIDAGEEQTIGSCRNVQIQPKCQMVHGPFEEHHRTASCQALTLGKATMRICQILKHSSLNIIRTSTQTKRVKREKMKVYSFTST